MRLISGLPLISARQQQAHNRTMENNKQTYTIEIIEETEKRYRPVITWSTGVKEALPTYRTCREALTVGADYLVKEGIGR